MSNAQDPNSDDSLLTGNLRSTVFLLALPVLGEQFLSFLVGFYDVYLSGHLPSEIRTDATSAVGVAAYIGWLASLIFSLVATGTTALTARAWGAGDRVEANTVANRSLALSIVAGATFMAFILPAAPTLVRLIGLEGNAAAIAVQYLRLDAFGLLFASISIVLAAAYRASGDMHTPMWAFGSVSILNVIVSTMLVHGFGPIPAYGVAGIVLGTVVARVAGGLLILGAFLGGQNGLHLQLREVNFGGEIVRRILAIGIPSGAEGLIIWVGHCLFLRIITQLGNDSFAAHIIGVRVEAITYLPAVAYGYAAATMVGQSLGAGDHERAVKSAHEAVRQCSVIGLLITLCFLFGAELIFDAMHGDPDVCAIGIPALQQLALFQIPLILGIVYFAALRGAGETRFPMYVALVTTYVVRLSLGYYFGITLNMGLFGAWIGMTTDMLLRGLIAAWRFRSRRWLNVRV